MTLRTFITSLDSDKEPHALAREVEAVLKDLADQTSDGNGLDPVVSILDSGGKAGLSLYSGAVNEFHQKFGVLMAEVPAFLDVGASNFRQKFLQEELDEFAEAVVAKDLAKAGDALVDLIYVAVGTALMMGLPLDAMFMEVQAANMRKVRAQADGSDSTRKSALDVVKPAGWTGPNHERLIGEGPWPTFMASGSGELTYSGADFEKLEAQQREARGIISSTGSISDAQVDALKADAAELSPGQQAIVAAIPEKAAVDLQAEGKGAEASPMSRMPSLSDDTGTTSEGGTTD